MPRRLLSALAALLCLMPSADAAIRQKMLQKVPFSHLADLMSGNRFLVTFKGSSLVASGRGFLCRFTKEQRRMLCNGFRLELLHPTVADGNSLWISTIDWYKTLRPILYPATVSKRRVARIMIDCGHGGSDPGAIGAFSKEKAITLAVGRKVADLLRAKGFQVVLTRNSDVQVPLAQIGTMQKRNRCDLFVSIHVNSAADKSISGVETYCLTPVGAASSNGGKASSTRHTGNVNDPANILLAWHVQRAILARTRATDRGIKRARFAVLRDISVPGVLVETGFISNRAEERQLNNPAYVDRLARGIAEGIILFVSTTAPK